MDYAALNKTLAKEEGTHTYAQKHIYTHTHIHHAHRNVHTHINAHTHCHTHARTHIGYEDEDHEEGPHDEEAERARKKAKMDALAGRPEAKKAVVPKKLTSEELAAINTLLGCVCVCVCVCACSWKLSTSSCKKENMRT